MDEHVLRGNTGILKCHIPSFVTDYVFVEAWIDEENKEFYAENSLNRKDVGMEILFS